MSAALTLLATGPLTTVQDLGRPGWAHLGVGRSGAADRPALRLANRLVGNPEGAPALEVTLGGLEIRAAGPLTLALTGAPCPVTIERSGQARGASTHSVLHLRDGEVLRLGVPARGLRTYLAVRGGLAVEPVLGSCATDTLARLGPPVVQVGERLEVGSVAARWPCLDAAPVAPLADDPTLRVLLGPRADWVSAESLARLTQQRWVAGGRTDRVGVRLDGPALVRRSGELPSEGMVPGALQVPPDGQPVLFLADHPVTGGYPVVGVVHPDDLPRAAQLRPGDGVRLRV